MFWHHLNLFVYLTFILDNMLYIHVYYACMYYNAIYYIFDISTYMTITIYFDQN